MGIELHSSYIHLGPRATVGNIYCGRFSGREWFLINIEWPVDPKVSWYSKNQSNWFCKTIFHIHWKSKYCLCCRIFYLELVMLLVVFPEQIEICYSLLNYANLMSFTASRIFWTGSYFITFLFFYYSLVDCVTLVLWKALDDHAHWYH